MRTVRQQSIPVPLSGGDILNLQRFTGPESGPPVLMLHGAIENGRIFYSGSGKGLAPFLARNGFDVYVADLRGRGKSRPPIKRSSRFGQTEAISEDIPACVEAIKRLRGPVPQQWVAHSWGGVLFSSVLARFPEYTELVRSLVYFGSKRTIRVWSFERIFKVELVWKLLCPLSCLVAGYLPARWLRIGSDSETVKSYRQSAAWVKHDAWIDSDNGFDYGAAIKKISLPPIWYIAAENDHVLGHPRDVQDFMKSAGRQQCRYTVLSRTNGNLHDYDHISMLTHPDAIHDHFPEVLEWLQQDAYKEGVYDAADILNQH
ncbi:MAG: alpha/beta fold hydrolase [Desulfuromonadaceae bacterium]|nr:alpha/beta fold hydrolase [Desulfuromonadaceae bacterium]